MTRRESLIRRRGGSVASRGLAPARSACAGPRRPRRPGRARGAALAVDEEAVVARAAGAAGRDSIFVRFTPRKANSDRQRTSQPGLSSPEPQKASDVFAGVPSPGTCDLRAAREPDEARRVARLVLDALGEHGRAVQLGRPPRADRRPRRVLRDDDPRRLGGRRGAARPAALGTRSRRKRAHCEIACGCDSTRSIDASASGEPAMRCWETASTSSPTTATSLSSSASVSSVTPTGPSSEFSIGTIARSTLPS